MKRLSLAAALIVVFGATAVAGVLLEARSDSGGPTSSLVYADQTGASSTIWRANADGTHPARLTNGSDPTISPNGRFVAFARVTCTPMAPSRDGICQASWNA